MVDVIRSRRLRHLGLLLAYALTTVMAQVGHLHGHHVEPETQCQSICEDSHPHLSGHPSPDLGHAIGDCPACQLRSLPQLIDQSGPRPSVTHSVASTVAVVAEVRQVSWRCPSCRAPPLS